MKMNHARLFILVANQDFFKPVLVNLGCIMSATVGVGLKKNYYSLYI
jgi:hypothetical protein